MDHGVAERQDDRLDSVEKAMVCRSGPSCRVVLSGWSACSQLPHMAIQGGGHSVPCPVSTLRLWRETHECLWPVRSLAFCGDSGEMHGRREQCAACRDTLRTLGACCIGLRMSPRNASSYGTQDSALTEQCPMRLHGPRLPAARGAMCLECSNH